MRRLWLILLAVALLAPACGGGERPRFDDGAAREVGGGATTTAAPTAEPVTLRLAVPEGWSNDPADAGPASVTNRVVADLLYEGLVRLDDAGRPEPALAERWFVDESRTTWTFVLADDAIDGDGDPITARDAKLSLERIAARGPADQNALALTSIKGWRERMTGAAGGVAGIVAPDATTLVVMLDAPFEPLLEVLATPAFGITGVGESGLLRTTGAFRRTDDPNLLEAVDPEGPVAAVELVAHPDGPHGAVAEGAADWAVLPVVASSEGLDADIVRQPLDLQVAVVVRLAEPAERRGTLHTLEPLLLAGEVPGLVARVVAEPAESGSLPSEVRVDAPEGRLADLGSAIAAQLSDAGVTVTVDTIDAAAFSRRLADGAAEVFPILIAGPLGVVGLAEPGSSDDLFGLASSTRAELVGAVGAAIDPEQRRLFIDALERSLIDAGLVLPIGRYEVRVAIGRRLDGLGHRADGTLDLSAVAPAT